MGAGARCFYIYDFIRELYKSQQKWIKLLLTSGGEFLVGPSGTYGENEKSSSLQGSL